MNRIASAAVAALLAASPAFAASPALGGPSARPASAPGKMRAPVAVEARLEGGTAKVIVRFDRAATGVRVDVKGLDGLKVTSTREALRAERVEQGEVAAFDVTFEPGPGRSLLSVAVTGSFGGSRRATTASFPVGEKSAAQRKRVGAVVGGADGERVKVLPAGR
jgi:hypothetical protein